MGRDYPARPTTGKIVIVKPAPSSEVAYVAELQPDGTYVIFDNGLIPLRTAEAIRDSFNNPANHIHPL